MDKESRKLAEEWAKASMEAARQSHEYWEAEEARRGPPPRYSGLAPICPKCALLEGITARYCVGWRMDVGTDRPCRAHKHPHLHRACPYCAYAWTEAPADGYRTVEGDMLPGILYEEKAR